MPLGGAIVTGNNTNCHTGHRKRVRDEFIAKGFDKNTPPHKILEMLLFYSVPQVDTNITAHNLINRFKSLNGVFSADINDLKSVAGIGENSAVLIKLVSSIMNVCACEKNRMVVDFATTDDIGEYLLREYIGINVEKLGVLCIDTIGRKLDFEFVAEGNITAVGISSRDIIRVAVNAGATNVVLCHNHPNGVALPSNADEEVTKFLADTLSPVGIRILDHIIISGNDYISMAQSQNYSYIFE